MNKMRRILWEVTTKCNLRCKHCYLHSELLPPSAEPGDELGTEECLNIVDQFDEANAFLVEVVGGGEPFCRPDIMDILHYMGEKKFWTRVVTNGTLITEEIARDLADIDIQKMSVSLESSDPEINDAIRGTGSFKRAIRGINYFRDFGISFRIHLTVNALNYRNIEETVAFCYDMGAKEITIAAYANCPTTNPFSASMSLGREEHFSAAKKIHELKEKYSQEFVYSDVDKVLGFLSPELKTITTDRRFHRCDCVVSQVTVIYNGNVLPCPLLRDKPLGNLMEIDLSEIPQLPEFKKIKNMLEITVDEANEQCRACEWRYICGGGCRGQAYLVTGNFMAPNPQMCLLAKGEYYE
jgi:radical SAM protein with 4Fe4S-binding SPASM domain